MQILGKRETITCDINCNRSLSYNHKFYPNTVVLIKNIRLSSLKNLEKCELWCGGSTVDSVYGDFLDYHRKENNVTYNNIIPFNLTENHGLLVGLHHEMNIYMKFTQHVDDLTLTYDVYDVKIKNNAKHFGSEIYRADCKNFTCHSVDIPERKAHEVFYCARMKNLVIYSPDVKLKSSYDIEYSLTTNISDIKQGKIILSYATKNNYVYKIFDENNIVITNSFYANFLILFNDCEYERIKGKNIKCGTYFHNKLLHTCGMTGLGYSC